MRVDDFNDASWWLPVFYRSLSPKLPRLWRVLWGTKSRRPHGLRVTLEPFASTVWGAGAVMRLSISEFWYSARLRPRFRFLFLPLSVAFCVRRFPQCSRPPAFPRDAFPWAFTKKVQVSLPNWQHRFFLPIWSAFFPLVLAIINVNLRSDMAILLSGIARFPQTPLNGITGICS